MNLLLRDLSLLSSVEQLSTLPEEKLLINTINAHSYNVAQKDEEFANALVGGDVLIPDGIGVVKAVKWLNQSKISRITGWDLFVYEMKRLNSLGNDFQSTQKKVCFVGSSPKVLKLIQERTKIDYPNLVVYTYSPPYVTEFSNVDTDEIILFINNVQPDLLWIGMTAPKQEKWAFQNYNRLNVNCHIGTIGAVFDFYAGTVERAPDSWQQIGFEWLFRLLKEPRRMWKRYLIGNVKFAFYVLKEKNVELRCCDHLRKS